MFRSMGLSAQCRNLEQAGKIRKWRRSQW